MSSGDGGLDDLFRLSHPVFLRDLALQAQQPVERSQAASGVDIGALDQPPGEAVPAAKATFKGIDAPRGEADDLKRIIGVTPKLEQRLNDAGVFHFWQIADLDADNLKALDLLLKTKGQIEKEEWVSQAKKMVEAAAI